VKVKTGHHTDRIFDAVSCATRQRIMRDLVVSQCNLEVISHD